MESIWYKFNRWFEIHIGIYFVNGNKQTQYLQYLKNKYCSDKDMGDKVL